MRRLIAFFLTFSLILSPAVLAQDEVESEGASRTEAVAQGLAEDTASSTESTLAESAPEAEETSSEEPAVLALPASEAEGSFSPVLEDVPSDQRIVSGGAGLDEKVSLDLRNIEVADALRFLALKGGLNMAVSKSVSGRVQLLLNDVPIRDILDIILITNGLAYEKRGDVYNIMTEPEYRERFGRKFSDTRDVRLFKLNYAVPEQAFSLFEVLKSEIGRLLVDPESGTVLVMDSPANIQRMELALASMEEKRSVRVFHLQYAKALEVETRLKSRLDTKKVGYVIADERTNSVIIETLPGRMEEVEKLIKELDQKTQEVLIDAKIIKVTVRDDFDAEIKWEGLFAQMKKTGEFFAANHGFAPIARASRSFIDDFVRIEPTTTPTAGAKNELTENLFLGRVGEDSFELLINFLRTLGETKIISNPKLAVVNNQEAKIHVGEKQAYVTTTTTTGQTTTTTAESVTFVDVGIQLNVTPTINDEGFVTMKIKPEISSVIDFLTTPSGNRIPIIDSSLAETSVMVKDGVSIIIGGLRGEQRAGRRKKIPVLGDIPILGAPFNSFTEDKIRTELLILITPHVIYGDKLMTGERQAVAPPYMSYSDYEEKNLRSPLPEIPAEVDRTVVSYGPPRTNYNNNEPVKGATVRS